MKKTAERAPAPARRPRPSGPRAPWGAVLAVGLPVLAALLVHAGALDAFFSTDDLILFERVRGIVPFPPTLWRLVSGRLFYQALFPFLGTQPLGWHVVGLLLHALATALAALTAKRLGASNGVAFLAALAFGVSAKARMLLMQASGTGEILATVFVLAALMLMQRRGALAALPAHAAALLSKENVALAPLALMAGAPRGERLARLRTAAPALALSAAMWAYILLARGSTGSLGGEAYAFGFGPHLFHNLVTYALWAADPLHLSGAIPRPGPLVAELAVIAVLGALAAYAWRTGDGVARFGLAFWLAMVLPVLPLANAVYEHYVYAARFGLWLAIAQALQALFARGTSPAPRRVAIAFGVLGALQAASAAFAIAALGTTAGTEAGLPRDSFLRKMAVIRNVARTLGAQLGPDSTRLVVYVPESSVRVVSGNTGRRVDVPVSEARYMLLPAVLDEGRGLRALFPQVSEVRFGTRVERGDSGALVATHSFSGEVIVTGTGPAGHAKLAALWSVSGLGADARAHLGAAQVLYPGSALLAFAAAHAAPAESVEARLLVVRARFPDSTDTFAAPAR